MSFFDDASLVMIPSGYKDQKVYSVKPIDGSGDLTFSRGSDIEATRVASNGYIEKAKVNLLLQSNTFNTTWTTTDSSVTSGQAGYDGSSDAWKLQSTVLGRSTIEQSISLGADIVNTFSVYAKAGNVDFLKFIIVTTGSNSIVTFDLSDGSSTSTSNEIDVKSESVGNDWYRLSLIAAPVSTITSYKFEIRDSEGSADSDVGSYIYIQDAQLNYGLVAQDYVETTTTSVVSGITNDMPRLDFSGGASCPSLLLEPSRTNVIEHSEYLGEHGISNVSVSYNNATSPEGVQNATLVTGDAVIATKVVNFNSASNGAYTISVFAKYNSHQWIQLGMGGVATYANFDIQNGVVGGTNGTSDIEDYGNGWYRCSVQTITGTPISHFIGMVDSSSAARLAVSSSTDSFWAYGMQSEIGSYPTSLIPTYGTSATRTADYASKTGISSLIGQTEGTIFLDIKPFNTGPNVSLRLSDGTNNNRITFEWSGAKVPYLVVSSGGALQVYQSVTCALNTQHKIAIGYKANDFVIYIDGVLAGSDTSGSVPSSLSQFRFGETAGFDFNGEVNQALLFKTRLSNADLATLTA